MDPAPYGNYRDLTCRPIIGVDPGIRWSGFCVRVGVEVVDAFALRNPATQTTGGDPAADVVWFSRHQDAIRHLARKHRERLPSGARWTIAAEGCNWPAPQTAGGRRRQPKVTAETAATMKVYGAVLAMFPTAVVVEPRANGERHLGRNGGSERMSDYYPRVLCGYRPKGWTATECRDREHERSAFDVCGLAEEQLQQNRIAAGA